MCFGLGGENFMLSGTCNELPVYIFGGSYRCMFASWAMISIVLHDMETSICRWHISCQTELGHYRVFLNLMVWWFYFLCHELSGISLENEYMQAFCQLCWRFSSFLHMYVHIDYANLLLSLTVFKHWTICILDLQVKSWKSSLHGLQTIPWKQAMPLYVCVYKLTLR
jgi:hypothetical protein